MKILEKYTYLLAIVFKGHKPNFCFNSPIFENRTLILVKTIY